MSESPSTPSDPTPTPPIADDASLEVPTDVPAPATGSVAGPAADASPVDAAASVGDAPAAASVEAAAAPVAAPVAAEAEAPAAAALADPSSPAQPAVPPPPAAAAATVAVAPGSHAAHGRLGPKGTTRSPIGGWLLLIPTFGIYYLFWYFNINRELRDYDPSISVRPGLAVLSLFIPIVGLVSIFNTGNRIRQAQATAGAPAESSGLLGLILSFFLALVLPYYSSQLNKVWQHA